MNLTNTSHIAKASRNTVFRKRWNLEALCNGSYGSEHNEERTQERSDFGAKDLSTGLCNSNDLISSEMT